MVESLVFWIIGVIVYIVIGFLTFAFVYTSFKTYNNLKSFTIGILWPLSWIGILGGAAFMWLKEK